MDKQQEAMFEQNHREVLAALDPAKATVIFCCGSTAGHINPALSAAQELQKEYPEIQIVFLARERGLENELIPRAGFPLYWIHASAFEYHPVFIYKAIRNFGRGKKETAKLIDTLPIKAAIGFGGFVSAPVIAACKAKGVPVLLHEQNAYPGKSNRSMAKGAETVCISFEETRSFFSGANQVVLTGNPVNDSFFEDRRAVAREKLGLKPKQRYVLATGGSLGARSINQAVLDLVERLERNPSTTPYLTHLITGKKSYAEVKAQVSNTKGLILSEYAYDMADQMAAADVIICRAGAGTCAELTAMGKPSILVPYPLAKGDHQTKNAAALAESKAAVLVPDQDISGMLLKQLLDELFADESRLQFMSKEAKALAQPEASQKIVAEIVSAMRGVNRHA